jgi:hypothetical protein
MPSIRKARRRLLRWERYDAKTAGWHFEHSPGHERARTAWRYATARRHGAGCWCPLCYGVRIDQGPGS